jgi:hypothetical protein
VHNVGLTPQGPPQMDMNQQLPTLTGQNLTPPFRQRAGTQPSVSVSEAEPVSGLYQAKRLRRQTDARAQNPCLQNLMTTMIHQGVQCNVQVSAPSTPNMTSRSLHRVPSFMAPLNGSKSDLMDLDTQLEVDSNCDDDAFLTEALALRRASGPAGVRKYGPVRYRSSAEAAQQCSNMKKNVPRMRRRPKVKPSRTTRGAPAAAGATTI